ncbi:hypothetical protein HK100_010366, partial [Physocladia obscura]
MQSLTLTQTSAEPPPVAIPVISHKLLLIDATEKLESGGFGQVVGGMYGQNRVTIKTLLEGSLNGLQKKEILLKGTIWHNLKHPNIVTLSGILYGADGASNPYLVMERMVTNATGQAKITNFGLAYLQNLTLTYSSIIRNVPQKHVAILFAPPEAFAHQCIATIAHDTYCFAMTMFEILFCEPPFFHENPEPIKDWVIAGEQPYRPTSDAEEVPDACWELINECWNQDPKLWPRMDDVFQRIF